MNKLYAAGAETALKELGLEKVAFGFDVLRGLSNAGGMKALGSMGSQALQHGGVGALVGGATGAMSADEGHRGSGFMRGALAGGAIGAGGGALSHYMAGKGMDKMRLFDKARGHGNLPLATERMGTSANRFGMGMLGASAGGMAGAAFGGGLAGGTAQQSPYEKLKSRIGGMFG